MATVKDVFLPDIGDFKDVDVIEVLVSPGQAIHQDDSLITLESDKATMEVPSPTSGTVREVPVKVGDKVSQGALILRLEPLEDVAAPTPQPPAAPPPEAVEKPPAAEVAAPRPPPVAPTPGAAEPVAIVAGAAVHASPSVRRFARELGADLSRVHGSGPKGRILKEDVQAFVKAQLSGAAPAAAALPPLPEVDFTQFGETETRSLTKIQQVSGANLHRNWVNIPHVTQFGEADITELDAFRREQVEILKPQGIRLSPLAFFVKAVVATLQKYPEFNAALHPDGKQLIVRKYYHIGVAVDTPQGLMVPVIRDADKKGLVQIAVELAEAAAKARDRKLSPADMQGGCFTISSLGGIGGTAFTPIINAPEAAILGVSRAELKPVYHDGALVPRLILPLSLAFDHRIVDGAAGARFVVYLGEVLSDVRRLLL